MPGKRTRSVITVQKGTAITTVVLLLVTALPAHAQSGSARYRFTTLLDSANGLTPTRCAAINGSGTVAVQVRVEDPLNPFSQLVILRDPSVPPIEVAHTRRVANYPTFCDNGITSITSDPSINEFDEVSFQGNLRRLTADPACDVQAGGQRQGIFLGTGSTLTTIAHTKNPPGNDFISEFIVADTSVNDSGMVAMTVELRKPLFDQALVVGSKTGTFDERFRNSASQFTAPSQRMSLNEHGQIAFEDGGIVLSNPHGSPRRIFDGESALFAAFDPSLNNSGQVAFQGNFFEGDTQIHGVFITSGGPVTTVVDSRGAFQFFREPSLNDFGQVVFTAELDEFDQNGRFRQGVFTGPHAVHDKVLEADDRYEGVRVSSVVTCSEALSNRGEIVMTVFSENPETFEVRRFIVRATPR